MCIPSEYIAFVLYVVLGALAGGLGTIIGAGGAFIVLPVLILFAGDGSDNKSLQLLTSVVKRPELLTTVSLGMVFANAASGSFAYARMKRIDFKSALLFAVAGIPGSIIGAKLVGFLPQSAYRAAFGLLMVAVSIYIFFRPQRKNTLDRKHAPPGHAVRHIVDIYGNEYRYTFNLGLGMAISVGVGFLSSTLGIGGGIVHVPAMTQLLNFPVHVATASSCLVLAIMSLTATIVHIIDGDFTTGVIAMVIPLSIGAILGAQVGAGLSKRIKGSLIVRVLSITLAVAGVRILITAFHR